MFLAALTLLPVSLAYDDMSLLCSALLPTSAQVIYIFPVLLMMAASEPSPSWVEKDSGL